MKFRIALLLLGFQCLPANAAIPRRPAVEIATVLTMATCESILIKPESEVRLPFQVDASPGLVLVDMLPNLRLTHPNLDDLDISIISPCSGDCSYEDSLILLPDDSSGGEKDAKIFTNVATVPTGNYGGNPRDDGINGIWYLKIVNRGLLQGSLDSFKLIISARWD
jgi:hypothetical protein